MSDVLIIVTLQILVVFMNHLAIDDSSPPQADSSPVASGEPEVQESGV